MTDTLIRSIQVQEVDTETGTFTGLVAPYDEVIEIRNEDGTKLKEQYGKGLFDHITDASVVPVYFNHGRMPRGGDMPVGRLNVLEDSDKGVVVSGKLGSSARALEAHALMKDGTLNALSAEFVPTKVRKENDVTVYEKAELLEVSLVFRGAYPSARVSEVRSEESLNTEMEVVSEDTTKNMTELNYDDSEIRSGLENLERRFEVLANKEDNSAVAVESKIRSFGEYVKGISNADEDALSIHRAYTGGTSADTVLNKGWAGSLVSLVEERRPLINAFDKGQWVAEGSAIEWALLNTNTLQVQEQSAEGADLAKGKVTFTTQYSPKKTYGGWTEMSLQEVQDASVNVLDTVFKGMANEYAKRTEAVVRAALAGAAGHAVAGASIATFDGWTEYLVDASLHLQDEGLAPEFIVVSGDVYKDLAGFSSNSNYLLSRSTGTVNITSLTGEVLNLPMIMVPGTGVATVAHSSAIKVFEQPGAPFNLHDTNIVNLTDQYSVYGRMVVAVQNPDAIVKVGA